MTPHKTHLLATAAASVLVMAAPVTVQAQLNEAETTATPADEQRLSCRSEVRALRDTVRSEAEYENFSGEFEKLITEASDPEATAGVCLVRLLQAQQFLADQGVVLSGYNDQVKIFETIDAAKQAGALSTEEAAGQMTTVDVEARPARVAVSPEAARVTVEREATSVDVSQRAPEITVEQPASSVTVEQAQPNVAVNQPEPQVNVDAAAPEVEVSQPAPEVSVQQAQPEIKVSQAKPQVTIDQPQPEVTIRQFRPEVDITQPAPNISVEQPEPEVAVVQPEPEVTVEAAEPVVTVTQAEPNVSVDYAKPDVAVSQREPEVIVESAEAEVTVAESEPQVEVTQGEPTVEVAQAEPQVSVDQAEAEVSVAQERAEVTTEMGEAEVGFSAETGVDVEATRQEGVDVAVAMEEPTISVEKVATAAVEAPEEEMIAFEEIEFPFDRAVLTDTARGNVRDAADLVTDESMVVLTGYASPIGDEAYNQELSKDRVQTVRAAMENMGVPADRITASAEGESDAEEAAGENARSEENRRVEIRVVPASFMSETG